jgi:hypothetical protein
MIVILIMLFSCRRGYSEDQEYDQDQEQEGLRSLVAPTATG